MAGADTSTDDLHLEGEHEPEPEAPSPSPPAPPSPPSLLSRLRRFAPLLLVGAAIGAAVPLIPHLPREHTVDLRLDDPSSVTAVQLAWAANAPPGPDAPSQGGTWRFEAGRAPRSLQTVVRLPNGRYDLDVTVERGPERDSFHRVVMLGESDRVTIPVRRSTP